VFLMKNYTFNDWRFFDNLSKFVRNPKRKTLKKNLMLFFKFLHFLIKNSWLIETS